MIPLPKRIQLAVVEIVVVNKRRFRLLRVTRIRLDPGVGRLPQISRQADQRKATIPRDRDQGDHTTGAAVI